jgi:hypothetical protein
MTKLLPLWLGLSLGLLAPGCRRIAPEASVEGIPQACCASADSKLQSFKGCRIPQRGCKARRGEKFWMRGDVACGPVDEGQCAGGRCCEYRPQYDANLTPPIENWAPPGFDKPTNNVTDPEGPAQHDVPGGGTTKAEPAKAGAEPEPEPELVEPKAASSEAAPQ